MQSKESQTAYAMQLSHELLTPAFAIKALASRVMKLAADRSNTNITRINNYLVDLLEYSNLLLTDIKSINFLWRGFGSFTPDEYYRVEVCDLKKDIIVPGIELISPLLRTENNISKNCIHLSGTFPKVKVDINAFRQVFYNLLSNSIKYRHTNNKEEWYVKISGEKQENKFVIIFSSYSFGIEEDEKDKIFLLGYRSRNSDKYNVKGAGIGLAIVKRILSDFKCEISVVEVSNPMSFKIILPKELICI